MNIQSDASVGATHLRYADGVSTREAYEWRTMQPVEPGNEPMFWVEHDSPEEPWIVAYGFVGRSGKLALAEVRVFPLRPSERRSRRRLLGTWKRDPKLVPDVGLSARVLRTLRPGEALRIALASVLPSDLAAGNAGDFSVRADRAAPRQTKPRRDPQLLALVAVLYEQAMSSPRTAVSPGAYVWSRLRNTEHQYARRSVERLIREARNAGFLSRATKGRAGGRATQAAHELCRKIEN